MKDLKSILLLLLLFGASLSCSSQNLQEIIDEKSKDIKTYNEYNYFLKNSKQKLEVLKQYESTNLKSNKIISTIDSIKIVVSENYNKAKNDISQVTDSLQSGEISFIFKNIEYYGFIADLNQHNVKTYLLDTNNRKLKNIKNTLNYIKNTEHKKALMITNAGMFMQNNSPQGLLIIDSTLIKPLDIKKKGYGNFYMQPNGVFYISENKAYIKTTFTYFKDSLKFNVDYATQSGPMLVINGKTHHKFNYRSKNLNIRSGVGILKDGRLLFLISTKQVNFYDFATVYKDLFACANALYLDGAISKMYLPKLNPKELGGNFGPFISITKK